MSILFDMLTLKSNVYLPFVISPEFPHAELIASDIEWCYTFWRTNWHAYHYRKYAA
jgi:hypothetical protein